MHPAIAAFLQELGEGPDVEIVPRMDIIDLPGGYQFKQGVPVTVFGRQLALLFRHQIGMNKPRYDFTLTDEALQVELDEKLKKALAEVSAGRG